MKRPSILVLGFVLLAVGLLFATGTRAEEAKPGGSTAVQESKLTEPLAPPSIQIDKTSLENGRTIVVTGTAPAGKPVFIEVWGEKKVRASRFDADPDKETLAVVKGIGEPAAAATAPAIANAIYDAVGVRIKDLPITPDKVLAALQQKASQTGSGV